MRNRRGGSRARVSGAGASADCSWKRTSDRVVSRIDHGVAWILARASQDHLSGTGRLHIERGFEMPSAVATMYVRDCRWKPRNAPTPQRDPMLPSRLLLGSLGGSLCKTISPNPSIGWLKGRPRTRCHGVRPSWPRHFTLSSIVVCSRSHGIKAWPTGMILPIRASRHSLSVRNRPRTSITPTSVPPFDCESYFGDVSDETRDAVAVRSAPP